MVGRDFLATALAIVLMSPSLARAECTEAERQSAVPHVVAGREAIAEGDHAKGLAEFQQANDYCPDGWLLPYIATAQVRTGQYVEALETIERFDESNFAVPPVPAQDDDSVEARRARQRIAAFQEMEAMRRRALRSVAEVVVEVVPQDATLSVDGRETPTTSGSVTLRRNQEGTVELEVESEGRKEVREVTFVPGDSQRVSLDLSPPAPTPQTTSPVPSSPQTADEGDGVFLWGLAIAGAGLVPLGLGIGAIADAQSSSSEVAAQRNRVEAECQGGITADQCAQRTAIVDDNQSAVDTRRTLGWAGIVTGGVITTTGLILTFALTDTGGKGDRVSSTSCGFGLASLTCRGTF